MCVNTSDETKRVEIDIHGSLWINGLKIEEIDKMEITDEEIYFSYKNNIIGNIQRKDVKSMIEQNYAECIETDMIDNLMHLFDIRKEGDFGMVSIYDELCNFVTYNKKETYERTIKEVLSTIFGEGTYAFEINGLYASEKKILKRHIEPLPIIKFRKLTNLLCAEYEYIFIDFEAPDEVYGFNNMHDMLKLFNDLEFFDNLEKEDEEEIRRIITREE